jgi:hypothetical protein
MTQSDAARPDPRTEPALNEDELAAESADNLPQREALSLIDPGTLMGGSSVPSSTSGTPTTAPTTGDPAQSISLPGSLGSLSNKIIGTGGTSNG